MRLSVSEEGKVGFFTRCTKKDAKRPVRNVVFAALLQREPFMDLFSEVKNKRNKFEQSLNCLYVEG